MRVDNFGRVVDGQYQPDLVSCEINEFNRNADSHRHRIGGYFPSRCRGRSRSHSHRCVVEVRPLAESCIDRLRALEASVVRR